MSRNNDLLRVRARSVCLVMIMLTSLMASATFTSASISRTYASNRDPLDVALGDFDCDDDMDVAVATSGTHTISIHWNSAKDCVDILHIWHENSRYSAEMGHYPDASACLRAT